MEHYEEIMGLNVRHSTLASNFQYNETSRVWTVDLQSKDGIQTVHAKHVVLATGLLGAIPNRPTFPGEASFKGQILHTSAHKSAALMPEALKKKITIIGSGTSARDIAQDFINHGAENVTMVQRGAMYVVSRDSMERIQLPLWNTPGVSLEDADLLSHSLPMAVARTLSVGESQMMSAKDKDMLDALERAGMAVKRGDGDSLLDYQLIKGGHFYADQGACQMIIDGRIKVRQCEQGVQGYYEDGVILADGTNIESEVVILATGFELSTKLIERLMGEDVMNKVARICTLDDSQERIGVRFIDLNSHHSYGCSRLTLLVGMETDWCTRILVHDRQLYMVETVLWHPRVTDCCHRTGDEHRVLRVAVDRMIEAIETMYMQILHGNSDYLSCLC